MDADSDRRRARLRWQCRRGMRELDLLLLAYLDHALDLDDRRALRRFERLLATPDAMLFDWLMGRAAPLDGDLLDAVEAIRQHAASR